MILILNAMPGADWRHGQHHIPSHNVLYYQPYSHYTDSGDRTDGSEVTLKSDNLIMAIFVSETPDEIDKEMNRA